MLYTVAFLNESDSNPAALYNLVSDMQLIGVGQWYRSALSSSSSVYYT